MPVSQKKPIKKKANGQLVRVPKKLPQPKVLMVTPPSQTERPYKNRMLHDGLIAHIESLQRLAVKWRYNERAESNPLKYEVDSWLQSAMIFGYKAGTEFDKWNIKNKTTNL